MVRQKVSFMTAYKIMLQCCVPKNRVLDVALKLVELGVEPLRKGTKKCKGSGEFWKVNWILNEWKLFD